MRLKDFGSHFQLHAFFGHKRPVEILIEIVDAVDAQNGKIARSIAWVLRRKPWVRPA
jgi:hypothetical protein